MEQLQQEQQFNRGEEGAGGRSTKKMKLHIHNPNTGEQTAKYLAKLVIQGLEQKDCGDRP